jgi:hypothetical protein
MALDLDELYEAMAAAASGAFKGTWGGVKDYTLPELKKLASTFVDIEVGLKARPRVYTKESAKILLRMQLRGSQAIVTATTALTIIQVEAAINTIMGAVKKTVNKAVGFALVA